MTLEDAVAQWSALRGQKLSSIRKGADITIVEVDRLGRRVIVEGVGGRKSRPFGELERVLAEMRKAEPVHVDSVLGGSGSSRNQPETLIANLPNVEWLTISRKKHLILRANPTHASGSLREVDSVDAAEIRAGMGKARARPALEIVLPVTDVGRVTQVLDALLGENAIPEEQGIYLYRIGPLEVRVVRDSLVDETIRRGAIVRTRGLSRLSDTETAQIAGQDGKVVRLTDHVVILDETLES
jgi:hypothetical protein